MQQTEETFEPTVKNLIEDKNLKWIYVGGKGGVGKTTTSSSLAVLLSQTRKNVNFTLFLCYCCTLFNQIIGFDYIY